MEEIRNRMAKLLCVKSIVTILLTAVFGILAVTGRVEQEFMTIYAVIISFYFGTQHERSGGESGV